MVQHNDKAERRFRAGGIIRHIFGVRLVPIEMVHHTYIIWIRFNVTKDITERIPVLVNGGGRPATNIKIKIIVGW